MPFTSHQMLSMTATGLLSEERGEIGLMLASNVILFLCQLNFVCIFPLDNGSQSFLQLIQAFMICKIHISVK